MKEENIKLGKSMLESAIREKGYSVSKLLQKAHLDDIMSYYNITDVDEFYSNIGTNSISAKLVANKLALSYQKQVKIEEMSSTQMSRVELKTPTDKQISLKGLNNIMIKFAGCCHPMYGDDIVGFVSAGRGVVIHRRVCPNVTYFRQSRLIDAEWKPIQEADIRPKKKSKQSKIDHKNVDK